MSLSYLQKERFLSHAVYTVGKNRGPFTLFSVFLVAGLVEGGVFSWLQYETSTLDAAKSYTLDLSLTKKTGLRLSNIFITRVC